MAKIIVRVFILGDVRHSDLSECLRKGLGAKAADKDCCPGGVAALKSFWLLLLCSAHLQTNSALQKISAKPLDKIPFTIYNIFNI